MKKHITLTLLLSSIILAQEVSVFQNINQETDKTQIEKTQIQTNDEILINSEDTLEIQTPVVNFITSNSVLEKINLNNNSTIIDIRAPQKIALMGAINNTNIHIAYENFNSKLYRFDKNKYFYDELKYEITSKNIGKESDIYIFDNYGKSVSQDVANFLIELGFLNVYAVEDGFEGSKARYGKFKNQRVVNGWKNKTDEWSLDFNPRIYWNECKYSFLFDPNDKIKCEQNF